jgi:hypothetical protein
VKIEDRVDSSFVNDILARSCFGYTRAVCAELRIPIIVAKEIDQEHSLKTYMRNLHKTTPSWIVRFSSASRTRLLQIKTDAQRRTSSDRLSIFLQVICCGEKLLQLSPDYIGDGVVTKLTNQDVKDILC